MQPESHPSHPSHPSHASLDEQHLRVLSVLYFAYGGKAGFLALAVLLLPVAGWLVPPPGTAWMSWPWGDPVVPGWPWSDPAAAPGWPWGEPAATLVGCLFMAIGAWLFLVFATMAALRITTGLALRRHRHRTLCLTGAALTTLQVPIGTILGIATLVVLLRPSVEQLFSATAPSSAPSVL